MAVPEPNNDKINFNKLGSLGASPLEVNSWIAGAKNVLKIKIILLLDYEKYFNPSIYFYLYFCLGQGVDRTKIDWIELHEAEKYSQKYNKRHSYFLLQTRM